MTPSVHPAPPLTVPPATESGEHPAVCAYRNKLDSIVDGAEVEVAQLNRTLAAYLESVKTPVPPPPEDHRPVCSATPRIDIGHGVSLVIRALDGVPEGAAYYHPCRCGEESYGFLPFNKAPGETFGWDVLQLEPLTLAPSLLCHVCKHHGWIRNGRWEPC